MSPTAITDGCKKIPLAALHTEVGKIIMSFAGQYLRSEMEWNGWEPIICFERLQLATNGVLCAAFSEMDVKPEAQQGGPTASHYM